MPGFTYVLTLLSDATLTGVNATTDAQTLARIPGAALLGAAAAVGYPADPAQAWTLFHSGRVRFGCGFPVIEGPDGGVMAVPTPKTLRAPKGVRNPALQNTVHGRVEGPSDPVRKPFLAPAGTLHEIPLRTSVRTALDPGSGRAAAGKLFALQAVPAGTRFVGRVTADSAEDLARARELLAGRIVRLGRSRSAELGEARVDPLDRAGWLAPGPTRAGRVVLLCLSDLVLRGLDGLPCLEPTGEDVGLPGWAYSAADSAIRTRIWSPWNGHRRRPDLERQAIEAGSVLVFTGTGTPEGAALDATLQRGVGEYRQDGLGQMWLEPACLAGPHVTPWESVGVGVADGGSHTKPQGPLPAWLDARAAEARASDEVFRTAGEEARNGAYARIRASQWGELRALAQGVRAADELRAAVRKRLNTEEGPPDASGEARPRAGDPGTGGYARKAAWHGAPYQALDRYLKEAGDNASVALELLASRAVRARKNTPPEDRR